jgi:hypothetical protein
MPPPSPVADPSPPAASQLEPIIGRTLALLINI